MQNRPTNVTEKCTVPAVSQFFDNEYAILNSILVTVKFYEIYKMISIRSTDTIEELEDY